MKIARLSDYPTKADDPEGLERTGFLQCWFPGLHTDVGGGHERAYRDISDISLMWMIEMCSSALVFSGDLAESLKKPSDPNAWFPKRAKVPEDLGWGLSDAHDEYHSPRSSPQARQPVRLGNIFWASATRMDTLLREDADAAGEGWIQARCTQGLQALEG